MGAEMLFGSGCVPPLAVYERPEAIKVVLSTFNLIVEPEQGPDDKRFTLRLKPDDAKRREATYFRTSFNESDAALEGQLMVVLPPAFAHERIELHETRARFKMILPKKAAMPTVGLKVTRVTGD